MQAPYFFIGCAGSGMSALAQFLAMQNKAVKGSDRGFASEAGQKTKEQLEACQIECFPQDGSGMSPDLGTVVISTAIEEDHPELQYARQHNIEVVHRSEMLAWISSQFKCIAIAGTSGKSTVTALCFHLLQEAGIDASVISGAGIRRLQDKGLIGNAWFGQSPWLIIEADESDGSLVRYRPEVGVLLNIDRDHKEMDELHQLFEQFCQNTQKDFIVNLDHSESAKWSQKNSLDFGIHPSAPLKGSDFAEKGLEIHFKINQISAQLNLPGLHNMENALAAVAAAKSTGLELKDIVPHLKSFQGLFRRTTLIGEHLGIRLVDDFAHNPAKIAAAIKACQRSSQRVLAWFQPHGFAPTRFIREELSEKLGELMRPQDEIWISEIYYAGGTVQADISGQDLADTISQHQVKAHFCEKRLQAAQEMIQHAQKGDIILLMGARDPSLEYFAAEVWDELILKQS